MDYIDFNLHQTVTHETVEKKKFRKCTLADSEEYGLSPFKDKFVKSFNMYQIDLCVDRFHENYMAHHDWDKDDYASTYFELVYNEAYYKNLSSEG